MSLSELLKVLSPPLRPHDAVKDPSLWRAAEEEQLHARFPADFKDFIGTYGTGVVGDFVVFYNPFSSDEPSNFFFYAYSLLEIVNEYRYFPFPTFPRPEGLLPFAKTYDGDNLYWQTRGEPDEWPIVATVVRSPNYEVFPMTMTELLTGLIVRNRDRDKDIWRNSRIFRMSFRRRAPFITMWDLLDNRLQSVGRRLTWGFNKGNFDISVEVLRSHLHMYALELESQLVQDRLVVWESEGFIELLMEDTVYLRVLRPLLAPGERPG